MFLFKIKVWKVSVVEPHTKILKNSSYFLFRRRAKKFFDKYSAEWKDVKLALTDDYLWI